MKKGQLTKWEKIPGDSATDKRLISKIYKQLMQFHIKRTNNLIRKWVADLNRYLSKDMWIVKKAYEKMLSIANYWRMQIKTTKKYHLSVVRMAIIKKSKITNAGEGMEKRKPSYTVVGM